MSPPLWWIAHRVREHATDGGFLLGHVSPSKGQRRPYQSRRVADHLEGQRRMLATVARHVSLLLEILTWPSTRRSVCERLIFVGTRIWPTVLTTRPLR